MELIQVYFALLCVHVSAAVYGWPSGCPLEVVMALCSAAAIAAKIGLDQAVMAPIGTVLFFTVAKLLDGFQTDAVVPTVQVISFLRPGNVLPCTAGCAATADMCQVTLDGAAVSKWKPALFLQSG